jgi:lipoprotein-releasing system ATP-binding protein
MSELALQAIGLRKEFRTGSETLSILRGIDLEIQAGRTVAVTGESGSGKSTLLSILGGLDAPSSGDVVSGPYRLSALDEAGLTLYRRRRVGFIFQFHFLLRDFSAMENVLLAGLMDGQERRAAAARARALLGDVGLSGRLGYYPSQLSGGERQRVAVARALMNDPAVILADEPTGNLDESNSRTVAGILFEAVRSRGKAMVLVTHDRSLAAQCDQGYLLREGGLVQL